MVNFKYDNKVFLYLAAIFAGFALIELSTNAVLGGFFSNLFLYVGIVAVAFFSFVIIFLGFFNFFHRH